MIIRVALRFKIVILFVGIILSGCSNDLCGNTELQRVTSPNGEHDAVIFSRNCGSTTKEAFHISIMKSGGKVDHSAGNVYNAYDRISLEWNGDRTLMINGSSEGDDVFKAKTKYKKVDIIYLIA